MTSSLVPADLRLPLIDLGAARDDPSALAAAEKIDRACRETGFFLLTGHGISPALVNDWFDVSREFFELPVATKAAVMPDADSLHNGYHGMDTTALAKGEGEVTPPDLREYFMVGRPDIDAAYYRTDRARRFYHRNKWPTIPARFKAAGEAYYRAAEQLSRRIMGLFAASLGLPEAYFADKINRHFSVLSAIYYPVPKQPPLPRQLRAGAHTDYGSLTILAPTDMPGGLQVLTKTGGWLDVPYVPDAFIINIGDMLARWSNDRWVSTPHRVLNPPTSSRRVQTSPVGRVLPPSELRRRDRVSA